MWRCGLTLLFASGCDRLLGLETVPTGSNVDASATVDALACTASIAPGNFSAPAAIFAGASPSLSGDQQRMYFANSGSLASAVNTGGSWAQPLPVPSLNDAAYYDDRPRLSYDGSHIFLTRHPTPSTNVIDQPYEATLSDAASQTWGPVTPVRYPPSLAGGDVMFGVPSADGRLVPVSHGQVSHYHMTELALVDDTWTLTDTTAALYASGDDVSDTPAQLSPDGCWMVFARIDHNVSPLHVLMLATRGLDGNFGAPEPLFTTPSGANEQHPWIAPDGHTLYYFIGSNIF
ncbi:MAG: hypothetical protein JO257_08805, partial [Deltaproteobacteria bacterium]|nr:hypothetical protein [Deltaproteobacteria bacterium]